jgi:hypothetical protein
MSTRFSQDKVLLVLGVTVLIVLNLYTFIIAYPETYTITPGINSSGSPLAKDFSAYYVGAWRLWHNPSQVYALGAGGGAEPAVLPAPEAYKYLPSFLLLISPLLSLSYQDALFAFDVFQFMLLPLMAFLLYRLLAKKGLAVTFAVMVVALLLPLPTQNWGFLVSYYWQWGEGQAKVLGVFLLLLSFYLGSRGKPYLSGVALAFGFFDPRFGLLALPLFVMYNRGNLKAASASLVASLLVTNAMLLYPGLGTGFFGMVLGSAVSTPLYYYAFIPFPTLVALIIVNYKELALTFHLRNNSESETKNG